MAQGRSLRAGASLAIALVLVAATSAGAIAAPRGSAGVNASTSRTAQPGAAHRTTKLARSTRTVESRGTVNVKHLAAKKPTKRPTAQLPHLGKPGTMSGGPTTGGGTKTPKVAAAVGPPAPTDATTNSDAAATQTSFAGLAQSTDAFTAGEPPDPWVAVGPEHVVQAVNLELRMTDRQGAEKQLVSLPDFFLLPNRTSTRSTRIRTSSTTASTAAGWPPRSAGTAP